MSKYRVTSGAYFPVFGLNTKTYGVNLSIQSKYRKYGPVIALYLDIFYTLGNNPLWIKIIKRSKKTEKIRQLLLTNCLSVFDHFVELAVEVIAILIE